MKNRIIDCAQRRLAILLPCLFALVLATGCASTKFTNQERVVTGQIAHPANGWA